MVPMKWPTIPFSRIRMATIITRRTVRRLDGWALAVLATPELPDVCRGRGDRRGRGRRVGCVGRPRPSARLGGCCCGCLHRRRQRPQRHLRPRDGPHQSSGPPARLRSIDARHRAGLRRFRLRDRGGPRGLHQSFRPAHRRPKRDPHALLRELAEGPRRPGERRHRLPGRLFVPLRRRLRVSILDRSADPHRDPRRAGVSGDAGPRDHERHRGHAGRRRSSHLAAADRSESRGGGSGPHPRAVRRTQFSSAVLRRPRDRLRDPGPPRGRNVYLRRPPLGDKSGALPARHEVCDDRGPRGVPRRCVPVNVYESILERRRAGRLHMTLLDPDKHSATEAASLAAEAGRAGTDAIMVGGSTGVTQDKVDGTVLAIKEAVRVPVILFPASAANLSPHADALYFMSLLNSRAPRLIVGEQRLAAPIVKAWGLETIPMAYLVFEPGMRAGEIGDAELISRKSPTVAVQYALAAQMLGMKLVYLEAGSGSPEPVPAKVIQAVRKAIDIPVVVGGGIRTPEAAKAVAAAGADVVVTGTIVEVAREGDALRRIIEAVKAA